MDVEVTRRFNRRSPARALRPSRCSTRRHPRSEGGAIPRPRRAGTRAGDRGCCASAPRAPGSAIQRDRGRQPPGPCQDFRKTARNVGPQMQHHQDRVRKVRRQPGREVLQRLDPACRRTDGQRCARSQSLPENPTDTLRRRKFVAQDASLARRSSAARLRHHDQESSTCPRERRSRSPRRTSCAVAQFVPAHRCTCQIIHRRLKPARVHAPAIASSSAARPAQAKCCGTSSRACPRISPRRSSS